MESPLRVRRLARPWSKETTWGVSPDLASSAEPGRPSRRRAASSRAHTPPSRGRGRRRERWGPTCRVGAAPACPEAAPRAWRAHPRPRRCRSGPPPLRSFPSAAPGRGRLPTATCRSDGAAASLAGAAQDLWRGAKAQPRGTSATLPHGPHPLLTRFARPVRDATGSSALGWTCSSALMKP